MRLHRQRDIVEHAEIEKQRRDLERARQPERAAPMHRQRVMSWPAKRMRPASGVNWPVSCAISVVLPAPFGPITACSSPAATASVRSSVATMPPKRLARLSTCSKASLIGAPCRLSKPSMPPRANSTTSSSSGPRMICQYSVMPDSTSSSTSSATAPISGPNGEPMPPSTTMTMRSPERVQYIIAGLTKSVWLASSAPASPHSVPAMTKQTSR